MCVCDAVLVCVSVHMCAMAACPPNHTQMCLLCEGESWRGSGGLHVLIKSRFQEAIYFSLTIVVKEEETMLS